jgi:hypothetical protein
VFVMRTRGQMGSHDAGYGGDTPNIRAICAAVFRPEITASATSRRLGIVQLLAPTADTPLCPCGGKPHLVLDPHHDPSATIRIVFVWEWEFWGVEGGYSLRYVGHYNRRGATPPLY